MDTTGKRRPFRVAAFPRLIALLGGLAFGAFGSWGMIDPRSFYERVARFEPFGELHEVRYRLADPRSEGETLRAVGRRA